MTEVVRQARSVDNIRVKVLSNTALAVTIQELFGDRATDLGDLQ
jgi:hypothetical protein